MNDEINIKIPGQILDYVDTKDHLLDLFNYITNLQHQISLMEEDIRESKEINGELQQENYELNRMCELYGKSLYYAELKDYKSRCEKAIEYTAKQKKKMYKSRNKIAMFILMKLENILQNGSDDNE